MSDDAAETALHDLAAAVAAAGDDAPARHVLAALVHKMERAAGADLGCTDDEPVVVLQRRFGRAHLRLAAGALSEEQVQAHQAALQRPAAEQVPAVGSALRRLPQAGLLAEC